MSNLNFDKLNVSESIKEVLNKYDVDFVFQPIYSGFETIAGYEALMRPKNKSILEFIDEMTREDKLHDLEILTFFGATYAYKLRGYETMLSVNSFPTELFTEEELLEYTECFKMPREKVVVEILEYSDDKGWTWDMKNDQINRNRGVEVALDDFGTGFNDMKAVDYYRPHMIKVDRSLISDIDKDKDKQSHIKKLVKDMHDKLVAVLAEGVETKEEYDFLKGIGVDFYQGYYLGKPA